MGEYLRLRRLSQPEVAEACEPWGGVQGDSIKAMVEFCSFFYFLNYFSRQGLITHPRLARNSGVLGLKEQVVTCNSTAWLNCDLKGAPWVEWCCIECIRGTFSKMARLGICSCVTCILSCGLGLERSHCSRDL